MSSVSGCAPPNTRRAIRSTSSSVVTASQKSSSAAPASLVRCALGWQCWATFRAAEVTLQCQAMLELGIGLVAAHRYEEAFAVLETLCQTCNSKTFAPPELGERFFCETLIYFAKVCSKLGWESDLLQITNPAALEYSLVPGKPRLSGLTMMRVIFHDAFASLGYDDELTLIGALELGVCLLDQNLVDEAVVHLASWYRPAERSLGKDHAICLEINWRLSYARYKGHFFGRSDSRIDVVATIGIFIGFFCQSVDTLGIGHPTTLGIWASLQLCFEEQLDWTLDDVPREHIDALEEIPRPPGHKVFWK